MNPRPKKLNLLRWVPNALVTTAGPQTTRKLYLTFDDGPHAEHTPRLLDLLAEHEVMATFYLVGKQVEGNQALARRIADEGHTLGNHSYSHPLFETLSLADQLGEIERTDQLLSAIDGRSRHGFRSPRGVLPLPLMLKLISKRRSVVYWSYDSLDYTRRPAKELIEIVRQHPLRAGEIVLMHDDSPISLEMLKVLIPQWKAEGFTLSSLPRES
ncbi:MAG: polysaccharide deacetylase family protein [Pseudoxanthomonas sp.]